MEDRAKGTGNHPWFAKGNLLMGQVTCRHRSCPAFGRDGQTVSEMSSASNKCPAFWLLNFAELCWIHFLMIKLPIFHSFNLFNPVHLPFPTHFNRLPPCATLCHLPWRPQKTTVPRCRRCRRRRLAYLARSFVFRAASASLSRLLRRWSMKMAAWQWMMRGMLLKVDFGLEHRWKTGGTNTLMKLKTGRLNQVVFSNNQHPFSWWNPV